MEKKTVNALGAACPLPVVMATNALKEMQGVGTLEVLVDNEIAVQNLTRMAASRNLTAVAKQEAEGRFTVTIPVDGAVQPEQEPIPSCTLEPRRNTVVAIGTAIMGRGSEELGATLMKGYLYALSQQDKLPSTILFFNGGAHIPVQGSVSLEDLRALEAKGVEILTCGTCLNFYGLTEQLAVGKVTNMYEIAERLSAAGTVISL